MPYGEDSRSCRHWGLLLDRYKADESCSFINEAIYGLEEMKRPFHGGLGYPWACHDDWLTSPHTRIVSKPYGNPTWVRVTE